MSRRISSHPVGSRPDDADPPFASNRAAPPAAAAAASSQPSMQLVAPTFFHWPQLAQARQLMPPDNGSEGEAAGGAGAGFSFGPNEPLLRSTPEIVL